MDAPDVRPAILLVEDEAVARLMTSRQLKLAGYEVEAVANGVEALARLEKKFFPLLITDWEMPQMNGLELCQAVRRIELEGYVYTILLTSRDGKANIIEGLQAGADDYLTKPVDDNELSARLNTGRRILNLEQSLRTANRQNHLLSITDALTGAFNRRYLMEKLPTEIDRASRYGRPLSIILCDIDDFKQVNDTQGHQAGDEVLRKIAKLLMDSCRQDIDWVVRYGGEEFLIVLPETALTNAIACAEKMRLDIATHLFNITPATIRATASFGVTGLESVDADSGAGVDRLIARADSCLYRSKELGRNRVTGMGGIPDDRPGIPSPAQSPRPNKPELPDRAAPR